MTVMNDLGYNYRWQMVKIKAMMRACYKKGKLFIWGIGGWSDIETTVLPHQVDKFVEILIDLLKQYGAGVDFDWEHMSQLANGNENPKKLTLLKTLGDIMVKLRYALNKLGLYNLHIGYTTRFNGFVTDSKQLGFSQSFNSDG